MLLPKRINYRRRAQHRQIYLIGSPEFIEELYDKCIKTAENEGNNEEVSFLKESKKIALRQAEIKRQKREKAKQIEEGQIYM